MNAFSGYNLCAFFSVELLMSMERTKGSNKVLYGDALAQGQRPIYFTVFLTRKAFLSYTVVHVASSLKPLLQT